MDRWTYIHVYTHITQYKTIVCHYAVVQVLHCVALHDIILHRGSVRRRRGRAGRGADGLEGVLRRLFFDFDFDFGHILLESSCVSIPTGSQTLQVGPIG